MLQVNYLAIVVGVVASVLFSALYYFLLNKQVESTRAAHGATGREVRTTLTLNKLLVELVRTFVMGLVLAYAVSILGLTQLNQAAIVAFWLWLGFPVVLLVGSVIHERFPVRLAVIHAGDWLVKILIFTIILTYWK